LSQVAPNLQSVGYAIGAANKLLFTIWRIPPIDSASKEGEKLDRVEGAITMEHVDFYYPSRPSVKVLDNYSATFPSGKITALVGASGSGKSSVIGLIERFYSKLSTLYMCGELLAYHCLVLY
jgi:ATP-binding cassette subfamily B (MDR/TAP) protein 1